MAQTLAADTFPFQADADALTRALDRVLAAPLGAWMARAGLRGLEPFALQLAFAAEPEALDGQKLARRLPYLAEAEARAVLARLVAAGLVRPEVARAASAVRLADRGREAVADLQALIEAVMAGLPDFPGRARLAELLGRQVGAIAVGGLDAYAFRLSRRLDPGPGAPAWSRIRRSLADLASFRDDAHTAAWRAYGLPGHHWELFSHLWGRGVWGDPVRSADEAAAKLGFRGFGPGDYRSALAALAERGWVEPSDTDGGRYRLSDRGRQIREAAEVATDRRFFAPWDLAGDDERRELRRLMARARVALDG